MKVIIAGSRYGVYPQFFERKMYELFLMEGAPYFITELVSGCAQGVDTMGIDWADRYDIPVAKFHADLNIGPQASPIRNGHMAEYADLLVAFFNENAENRGTRNMCKQMADKGKKVIRCHEKLCKANTLILPPE